MVVTGTAAQVVVLADHRGAVTRRSFPTQRFVSRPALHSMHGAHVSPYNSRQSSVTGTNLSPPQ